MSLNIQDIEKRVKQIADRNPVYAEIIQWTGSILGKAVEMSGSQTTASEIQIKEEIPETWYKGKSVLDMDKLKPDIELIMDIFKQISLKADKDSANPGLPDKLLGLVNQEPEFKNLIKAVLVLNYESIDNAAQKAGIDPSLLFFLLRMCLRPYLINIAKQAAENINLKKWNFGHCPICGSAPSIAQLSDDNGKRMLHCSLCEFQWPYSRVGCPFCENKDSEKLNYLYAENEQGWRIYLCDKCGQYLKTIDLRIIPGQIILPLDDIATLHLDIIAEENSEKQDSRKELD